jgi:hypothetical protein
MVPSNSGQLQTVQMQTAASTPVNQSSTQAAITSEPAEEEPLYVNAKQYNRILKRRAARAKLESEGRIPRERKVCRNSKHEVNDEYKSNVFISSVNFFTNLDIDMQ